jgi:glycosyltransferase involved in cell wall biosynthesis
MTAIRIFLVTWRNLNHPKAGGSEVWATRVAEALVLRGHSVTYFSAQHEHSENKMVSGVMYEHGGGQLSTYSKAKSYFRRNSESFDVILEVVNTRPYFAFNWGTTPSVAMFHQLAVEVWGYESPPIIGLIGRYLLEPFWIKRYRKKYVLALSASTSESLYGFGVEAHVVDGPGNAVCTMSRKEKESNPTLVVVARLTPSKRIDDAIDAFLIAKKLIPGMEMIVIGGGVSMKPLTEKYSSVIGKGLSFLGRVDDDLRNATIARAHILLATSVREGWGLNVSEAALLGTPTIGYDVYGLRDSIPHSGGMLVEAHPKALAQAIIGYFEGEFELDPKVSVVEWSKVGESVETHLLNASVGNRKNS